MICVVADPRDLMAMERTGEFRGRYHVLGGVINPMEGIGPDQLKIRELLAASRNTCPRKLSWRPTRPIEGDAPPSTSPSFSNARNPCHENRARRPRRRRPRLRRPGGRSYRLSRKKRDVMETDYTAEQLFLLPLTERHRIMRQQAEEAVAMYTADLALPIEQREPDGFYRST